MEFKVEKYPWAETGQFFNQGRPMSRKRFEPDFEPADMIGEGHCGGPKPPMVTAIKSNTERFFGVHATSDLGSMFRCRFKVYAI